MTLTELMENLCSVDEISLLEALEITSEDLVNAFGDRIEEQAEKLISYFEDFPTEGY